MSDSLVLDIGGDIGALIIHAGPDLSETEIEISPGSDPTTKRSHNVVHARQNRQRTGYTAVFPSVPAGEYTIWRPEGGAKARVTVHGGQITEHRW
jgi:hypothetical protein